MPNETVWSLEPHTGAKHSILRRYLQAYYPKLSSTRGHIYFVDGFAGPGVYLGDEPGSPVIALDALAKHNYLSKMENCRFSFLFIEENKARFEVLRGIINERNDPPNVEVAVRLGTFDEHIGEAFDELFARIDAGFTPNRPSFVMVAPFGPKGLPLDLLRQLAQFPKTELLITFMYEPISRWLQDDGFEPHLDALFGTSEWRSAIGLPSTEKKRFLSELYAKQLRSIGMEHVRLFEMRDAGNRTEYFLAFATHNLEGLRVIKEAMWKVDAAGGVSFSDFTDAGSAQATMFEDEPNYAELRTLIFGRFNGQKDVPIEHIDDYVLIETAFRETHARTVFRGAEKSKEIDVQRPVGKNKSYWNVGTRITLPQGD